MNCGERKIYSTTRKSQNIMNMIVLYIYIIHIHIHIYIYIYTYIHIHIYIILTKRESLVSVRYIDFRLYFDVYKSAQLYHDFQYV